jgi:prephenate dehydrogenase
LFNNVVIIGTGLIGASVGINLISRRLASCVIGVGRGQANLKTACRRGAIHKYYKINSTTDLFKDPTAEVLCDADLILLATPVKTVLKFLENIPVELVKRFKKGCVITDVGSTKQTIVRTAKRRLKGQVVFVGGHPIAGTENTGAKAAIKDLFKDRTVILTPQSDKGVSVVRKLWKVQGARVVTMQAAAHDRLLGRVSHLPHMVAYALVNAVGDPKELATLAAGGFRDITRIASSDPIMWRDICLENKEALLQAMTKFEKDWNQLKKALKKGDSRALELLFARAKKRRDQFA